ncbi:hypothetical protein BKA82DRAFT_30121 [Pisolithus tinctorius]|nr:hypothetical protein BKA82DRAFT_30121 [Pisolithus tinctorius]
MTNLISFQLPITHPGTYRVSFTLPASGIVTLEITTVLPVQHRDGQVQVDPIETPKPCKSMGCDEQPVPTSDLGEVSLSPSLFNTPAKTPSKDRANVDDSATEPESDDEQIKTALSKASILFLLVSSSSLSQESVSTFVLVRRMQALCGDPLHEFTQLDTPSKRPLSPTPLTLTPKRLKVAEN